ncbi:hypothetical protein HDU96_005566 [Phlyctochytrium bullatum]|nr:hypothetical protein HDU96_005566 [Phlyctochytrium bullatum]
MTLLQDALEDVTHGAELVKLLVRGGLDIIEVDEGGWTPLYRAVMEGRTTDALILPENGADPNVGCTGGNTPLHSLMAYDAFGPLPLVKKMIEAGADVNLGDAKGRTVLQVAAEKGVLDKMMMLLGDRAEVVENRASG